MTENTVNLRAEAERQQFVQRARNIRAEIEQIFIDCASWNANSRARLEDGAAPIDPDPDGKLRRMADGLDQFIAREERRIADRVTR